MSCGVHFGPLRIKSQFLDWVLQKQEEGLMPERACAEWVERATLRWQWDSLQRLDLLVKWQD